MIGIDRYVIVAGSLLARETMTGNSRPHPLFELQLLGLPSIRRQDGTLEQLVLRQSKRFGLLTYLVLQEGPVPRDLVLANFWPHLDDHAARRALRQAFHFLRETLEGEAFFSSKSSVGIRPECWWCDVTVLEEAFQEHEWERVVSLYHGEFLSGFHLSQVDTELEFWMEEKRQRLREYAHTALRKFAEEKRTAGHERQAIDLLRQALALNTFDEVLLRELVGLQDKRGDRAGAIETYERFASRLRNDLEIEPAEETQTLVHTIKAKRLQIGSQEEEDLKKAVYQEMPRPITPLVGRGKEIDAASSLLRRDDVRLVSLTGTGGIGKTRIAIEVARQMVTEYEGVCYVALSSANRGFLVELAASLGLREDSRKTASIVVAHLSDRRVLLVLDNFETVLSEAGCLLEILAGTPRVKVLVASARPLRIPGEHEVPVEGLQLPTGDSLLGGQWPLNSEAVAYFLQCAKSIDPQFALSESNGEAILRACRAVDGIPLALELAASRLRELPIQELAIRLESGIALLGEERSTRPKRHRTMASAIWWTAKSLDPMEYELFLALSIFEEAFSLRAAEALFRKLFATRNGVWDAMGALTERGLVKRSFVLGGDSYSEMLSAVRVEARNELLKSGKADACRRGLIRHYSAWLRAGKRYYCSAEEGRWLRQIERESKSITSLLNWALDHDPVHAAGLVLGMWYYWWSRGLAAQGYVIVKRLLQRRDPLAQTIQGQLLVAAGNLALRCDDDDAVTCLEGAVEIFRADGNRARLGWALQSLGIALREKGELDKAAQPLEEALEIGLEAGNDNRVAFCQQALGKLALLRNDQDQAVGFLEGSLHSAQACGDRATAAWALIGLGDIALVRGFPDEALEYYGRARAQFEELGQKIDVALTLERLARVFSGRGEYSQANSLSFQSLVLYREVGYIPGVLQILVLLARQDLDRREVDRGVRILAGVQGVAEGSLAEPSLLTRIEDTLVVARSQCDEERFDALWRVGKTLSIDELVQMARERDAPVTLGLARQAEQ